MQVISSIIICRHATMQLVLTLLTLLGSGRALSAQRVFFCDMGCGALSDAAASSGLPLSCDMGCACPVNLAPPAASVHSA